MCIRDRRPLYVATYDRGTLTTLEPVRGQIDDQSRRAIKIKAELRRAYTEAYAIAGSVVVPVEPDDRTGAYYSETMTADLHAIVACNLRECFVVDAFVPWF